MSPPHLFVGTSYIMPRMPTAVSSPLSVVARMRGVTSAFVGDCGEEDMEKRSRLLSSNGDFSGGVPVLRKPFPTCPDGNPAKHDG